AAGPRTGCGSSWAAPAGLRVSARPRAHAATGPTSTPSRMRFSTASPSTPGPHRRLRSAAPDERLPDASERHGNGLAVHASRCVAAQERDYLRDLARLEHAVLRVDRSALPPHLLDADAAPLSLRLRSEERRVGTGSITTWTR